MTKKMPDRIRLLELFSYDKDTGHLTRKTKGRGRNSNIGDIAGGINGTGYVYVVVDGFKLRAHRLIWLMVYGVYPEYEIDHINRVRSDNRLANLRDVPSKINQNNRKTRKK